MIQRIRSQNDVTELLRDIKGVDKVRTLDCLGECLYKDFDYWESTKNFVFDSSGWTSDCDIESVRKDIRIHLADLIIPIQNVIRMELMYD